MAKQLVKQKELEQKEKLDGKVYEDHSASRVLQTEENDSDNNPKEL
jgi:hypothetical protein